MRHVASVFERLHLEGCQPTHPPPPPPHRLPPNPCLPPTKKTVRNREGAHARGGERGSDSADQGVPQRLQTVPAHTPRCLLRVAGKDRPAHTPAVSPSPLPLPLSSSLFQQLPFPGPSCLRGEPSRMQDSRQRRRRRGGSFRPPAPPLPIVVWQWSLRGGEVAWVSRVGFGTDPDPILADAPCVTRTVPHEHAA